MDELDGLPAEKKSRRITFLLAGIVIGVLGTIFVPSLVSPYLPSALRGVDTQIEGAVFKKQLEDGEKPRLLLSVDTEQGAVLATFTRKVAEIDMLVDEGDRVSLGVGAYEPFISDPVVSGVRKGAAEEPAEPDTGATDWTEAPAMPMDSAPLAGDAAADSLEMPEPDAAEDAASADSAAAEVR